MNTLNDHIEYLMMHHDCVVIPGWGALVAHYSESFYDNDSHLIEKPLRQVGFNASVSHNDGLLAQSLVRREGLTYDQAVRFIERNVTAFKQQLKGGGELGMGRLGFFHSDNDGHIEFIPFYHETCTDQYFGLRGVHFTPLDEQVDESEPVSEPRAAIVKPHWLRHRMWQTAASVAVLLGLTVLLTNPILVEPTQHHAASLSIPMVTGPKTADPLSTTTNPDASGAISYSFTDNQSANAAAQQLLLNEGGNYYLVVATLSSPEQADKYLTEHPDLMGHSLVQHSGRHYRVCVARAQTPQRLYQFMSELPKPYSKGWVFEEKLK
ncbi:MAG: hypothetical protein IKR25_04400 [Muribaculaceae bacterium]|nr:hypothetical protein [Muribaculaceae bacterium]